MKKDYIIVDSQIIKTLMNAGVSNYGAIILYSKIHSMSKKNGYCTASNGYFAELLCTTERNVKTYIKKLKDVSAIKTYEKKSGSVTIERKIYPKLSSAGEQMGQAGEEIRQSPGNICVTTGEQMGHSPGNISSPSNSFSNRYVIVNVIGGEDLRQTFMDREVKYKSLYPDIDYGNEMYNEDIPHIVSVLIIENLDDYEDVNELTNKVMDICMDYPYYCTNKDNLNKCINYFIDPWN